MPHLLNVRLRSCKALPNLSAPPDLLIEPVVRIALLEDIGRGGDLTTDAIVPVHVRATARFVARQPGIIAGLDCARIAFQILDPSSTFEVRLADGEHVAPGDTIAVIESSARALLTAERTALNLLSHCSGIATATRALVDAVHGYRSQITCTRKTAPGLRFLEKYAVRCGGGVNHRFGLDDAVLIKDNHLALAGSIAAAVAAVRKRVGHMVKIEIEVDTLEQLAQLLDLPVDAVLLDNMTPAELAQAVALVDGRLITEASGNITVETVLPVAQSGVDLISPRIIKKKTPALDIGLDVDP